MFSSSPQLSPEKDLQKWNSPSIDEKKRQFQELVFSPYWEFLPTEIQRRIQRVINLLTKKHSKMEQGHEHDRDPGTEQEFGS